MDLSNPGTQANLEAAFGGESMANRKYLFFADVAKKLGNAELARLQALKEREDLVPTADVKRMASTLGRQIRDNILAIPNRVAPLLAAARDSAEVHRLLSEELSTSLRVLSNG